MKIPARAVRAAATRKRLASKGEGSRKRPRSTSPVRAAPRAPPPTQTSPRPVSPVRSQRAGREAPVDLTADTPPEEPVARAVPPVEEALPTPEPSAAAEGPSHGAQPAGGLPSSMAPAAGDIPSTSGTAPAAPEPIRAAGRGAPEAISSRPSILNHGHRAERLVRQICLPEFQAELSSQGGSTFFREAYVSLLWAANSVATLQGVISTAEATLDLSRREAAEFRARAERAEEGLEAARAGVAEETDRLRSRAEEAERALDEANRRAEAELNNARHAEERQKEMERDILSLQAELHTITLLVRGAEERAENAEEVARRSDARAAAAEAEREEALEKARKAVEDFRSSASFEKELAETTAEVYDLGFQDCKEKAKRVYGLTCLDDLEPDEVIEAPPPPAE